MYIVMTTMNLTSLEKICSWYGGYNNVVDNCQKIGPISLISSTDVYKLRIETATFAFPGKRQWTICVGNGWMGSVEPVMYYGNILLMTNSIVSAGEDLNMPTHSPTPKPSVSYSPTRAPTRAPTPSPSVSVQPTQSPTFQVASSECGSPLSVDMSLSLRGYEQRCLTVQAEGSLHTAAVTMAFTRHTGGLQTPSDAGLIVFNTGNSRGVQIGGYSYVDDSVAGNRAKWPSDWGSLASSSSNAASVNISSYGVSSSAGYYRVCMVNGYKQAGSVRYSGSIALSGLNVACTVPFSTPSRQPSLQPSQTPMTVTLIEDFKGRVMLSFKATNWRGGQRVCHQFPTSGKLTGVRLDMAFAGDRAAASWASDLLVSMTDSQSCLEIGGRSVDPQFLTCASYAVWPSYMDNSASGQYNAVINKSPGDGTVARYEDRVVCMT